MTTSISRDQRRSRRRNPVRARTENVRRLPRYVLEEGRVLLPVLEDFPRPKTRADCLPGGMNEMRPCPFVSCRWNLYLDVDADKGSIKKNFPNFEPEEMPHDGSCALDVADRGGITLEEVGEFCNVTRERVRQIDEKATLALREFIDPDSFGGGFEQGAPGALEHGEDGLAGSIENESQTEPDLRLRTMVLRAAARSAKRLDAIGKKENPEDVVLTGADTECVPWTIADEHELSEWLEKDPWVQSVIAGYQTVIADFVAEVRAESSVLLEKPAVRKEGSVVKKKIVVKKGDLTERQRTVLAAYNTFVAKNGRTPRAIELADLAKVEGPDVNGRVARVCNVLSALRKKGLVPRSAKRARKSASVNQKTARKPREGDDIQAALLRKRENAQKIVNQCNAALKAYSQG